MTAIDGPVPERVQIFVTVGTELPFDRLVRAVDDWAGRSGRGDEVYAQIGHSSYRPEHFDASTMLSGRDFRRLFAGADLVVAHAGMGTIISALEAARPLVVVPRRADLGEHRNDHQIASVGRLTERDLVVAVDEHELNDVLESEAFETFVRSLPLAANERLIDTVRNAIEIRS